MANHRASDLAVAQARPEGRIANVSAALLMGGAGPTVARIARLLDRCFSELLLVGAVPPHPTPGRAVDDVAGSPPAPACRLRSLVAALHAANAERVLVVASDLLVVPRELVLALTAWPERDAVGPRSSGRPQPLCAIYRRGPVLEIASTRLAAGELELQGLLEAVDTGYLEGSDLARIDPSGAVFLDPDEPRDRQRAREILTSIT